MAIPVEGDVVDLPIDPQIVSQQAKSTIKSIVDAVVELVTNCDDSYRRLEDSAVIRSGQVFIRARREKGGKCPLLEVQDEGEGMDWESLEKAVTFAASVSGFYEGRSVRGLFGRGLKEAIIGLGRGKIRTVKDGQESLVEIFTDGRVPKYRIERKSRATKDSNGTNVSIEVLASGSRCPKFDGLYRQLANHFALRDILASPSRLVQLRLEDVDNTRTRKLEFHDPDGDEVLNETLNVQGLGEASLVVLESAERLEFSTGDPGSIAGIVVKTQGAILDSRLFGFDADEAAHYFYGRLECAGIADCIRNGDLGILDPNRSGLDWRHQLARSLDSAVREAIRPLVRRKREALDDKAEARVTGEHRKKLAELCGVLNALVEDELEDLPDWGRDGPRITTLTIRPEVGYAEPNEARGFTVYLPADLVTDMKVDPVVDLELMDVKGRIDDPPSRLELEPSKRYKGILSGRFSLMGRSYGDRAFVVARLRLIEDMAEIKVQAPGKSRRRRLTGTNRGLFREINFDPSADPIQRVSFSEGTMKIFTKFPPVGNYLDGSGEGMESPQGSLMLAELVAEGFCREVARRRLEAGLAPYVVGGEIDAFNSQVNQLMLKYLAAIHSALVA